MAYIFVTKLSYLSNPEFQVTDRPGTWDPSKETFYTLNEALEAGLFNQGVGANSGTKVKITEFVDFTPTEKPILATKVTELGKLIKL